MPTAQRIPYTLYGKRGAIGVTHWPPTQSDADCSDACTLCSRKSTWLCSLGFSLTLIWGTLVPAILYMMRMFHRVESEVEQVW